MTGDLVSTTGIAPHGSERLPSVDVDSWKLKRLGRVATYASVLGASRMPPQRRISASTIGRLRICAYRFGAQLERWRRLRQADRETELRNGDIAVAKHRY
jgi:hypothetical protein